MKIKSILCGSLVAVLFNFAIPLSNVNAQVCNWLAKSESCGHDLGAPYCAVAWPACEPVVVE